MALSLNRIRALIHKEFLAVLRDKKSRIILILPPLLQLAVFSFAATLDVKNVSMAILNRDNGKWGFELAQRFHGSPYFTDITYLGGVEDISGYIDNQRGVLVLSIDELFSRELESRREVAVQVILDGRKSNTAQIVAGYATHIINQLSADISRFEERFQQPIALVPRYWFNPNQLYPWFTVPGLLGILVLVEALIISGLSISRERELGTFNQLLVSPLHPAEILLGKAIPAAIISMVEGTAILFAGIYLFGIPFTGSFLLLYLSMFVFVLASVGIGLSLSALCATQQQAVLAAFVFISPSTLISGFATPIENMPLFMQRISEFIPLRYFLIISRGSFLKNLPFEVILQNIWPMALIAVVTLLSAALLFRRRMD